MKYKALLSQEQNGSLQSTIQEVQSAALGENQVLIKSHYSSINYKDALGVLGQAKIFRKTPLIGGDRKSVV